MRLVFRPFHDMKELSTDYLQVYPFDIFRSLFPQNYNTMPLLAFPQSSSEWEASFDRKGLFFRIAFQI